MHIRTLAAHYALQTHTHTHTHTALTKLDKTPIKANPCPLALPTTENQN